jgi:hypothetical protein
MLLSRRLKTGGFFYNNYLSFYKIKRGKIIVKFKGLGNFVFAIWEIFTIIGGLGCNMYYVYHIF